MVVYIPHLATDAGRHIHRDDAAMILGSHAYYDNTLNGRRAFLASDWGRKSVAFTGHGFALSVRQAHAMAAVIEGIGFDVACLPPCHAG